MTANVLQLFLPITTFIFDVDGVLTDGSLLVMPNGLMARRMNIKDGYALQLAVKKGYHVIIISGGNSPEVKDRLEKLGVQHVYMQVTNKLGLLQDIMQAHKLKKEQITYMGDDIPDLEVLKHVGVATCPSDAVQEVKDVCAYISPLAGGYGCGREVIEKTMKLQGHWNEDFNIRAQ